MKKTNYYIVRYADEGSYITLAAALITPSPSGANRLYDCRNGRQIEIVHAIGCTAPEVAQIAFEAFKAGVTQQ